MTKPALYNYKCEECNEVLECPKCGKPTKMGTNFSKYLRALEGSLSSRFFNNQNLDYIWFNYRDYWLITIEEKTNNGKSSLAQKQSHSLLSQMLEVASGHEYDVSYGSKKQIAKVDYKGYYIVQFEKTNPDDSKWIKINNKIHSKDDLLFLLKHGHLVDLAKFNNLPVPIIIAKSMEIK